MKNLKDNIWIEGFDSNYDKNMAWNEIGYKISSFDNIFYSGKTLEIPEEIAKECAEIHQGLSYWGGPNDIFYVDYNNKLNGFSKAKNSIYSACPQEYCIIFRK